MQAMAGQGEQKVAAAGFQPLLFGVLRQKAQDMRGLRLRNKRTRRLRLPATAAGILQSRHCTSPVERGEKGDGVELDQGRGCQGDSGCHRLMADVEEQRESDQGQCRAIYMSAAGHLPKHHRVPGVDQYLFAA